jgi:hypothetical protein
MKEIFKVHSKRLLSFIEIKYDMLHLPRGHQDKIRRTEDGEKEEGKRRNAKGKCDTLST